ncbi:GH39 family glycosyl hydrolase [Occallatibacter savannae]|uniref:GH39 family glycosyl hydrolase n=1 Tax=Occallatibacter savannae TaxID=1002691 RepID=UPI00194E258E|nr:glycosyl hydrolase family 39 [Occallatibacter savannae]
MKYPRTHTAFLLLPLLLVSCGAPPSTSSSKDLTIHWNIPAVINCTTPTLQVVVNPHLRPGDPLGIAAFNAIHTLAPDYVRFQAWIPYPKLAVAELQPPTPQSTSWDFSLIDPILANFLSATAGHPTVMDFSTIPQWMFVTDAPISYPADPNQPTWDYEQGTQLRDPTLTELSDYYRRLASWYVSGGFTDENGLWHDSGHHYKFPIWEVLNEPDLEHSTTAEEYTRRYDAIVDAVRSVSPDTKFMGLSLGLPADESDFIRYFLDPSNHLPGIPIDYISYHFYTVPALDETPDTWQYTLFQQADDYLATVRSVEAIRRRLSPRTLTDIDEFGAILPTDAPPGIGPAPPPIWWNTSAAVHAYMYLQLARMQIPILGEAQLIGFPSQYPTLTMIDWATNQPNARFWALSLLKNSFHPGDRMVQTAAASSLASNIEAQAYLAPGGRRLLLINKRNRPVDVAIPNAASATALAVDAQSAESPARAVTLNNGSLTLQPFAVAVVIWQGGG